METEDLNKNIEIKLEKQEVEIKIRNKNKNIKQELWHWNPSIIHCLKNITTLQYEESISCEISLYLIGWESGLSWKTI